MTDIFSQHNDLLMAESILMKYYNFNPISIFCNLIPLIQSPSAPFCRDLGKHLLIEDIGTHLNNPLSSLSTISKNIFQNIRTTWDIPENLNNQNIMLIP